MSAPTQWERERNKRIVRGWQNGLLLRELAELYELHPSRISKIILDAEARVGARIPPGRMMAKGA